MMKRNLVFLVALGLSKISAGSTFSILIPVNSTAQQTCQSYGGAAALFARFASHPLAILSPNHVITTAALNNWAAHNVSRPRAVCTFAATPQHELIVPNILTSTVRRAQNPYGYDAIGYVPRPDSDLAMVIYRNRFYAAPRFSEFGLGRVEAVNSSPPVSAYAATLMHIEGLREIFVPAGLTVDQAITSSHPTAQQYNAGASCPNLLYSLNSERGIFPQSVERQTFNFNTWAGCVPN